jgi:hypothetical protein
MELQLRKLIKEIVLNITTVTLSNGKEVQYGCGAHIKDIETILNNLLYLKNGHKRATGVRTDYARAVSILKSQKRRAQKYAEKYGIE